MSIEGLEALLERLTGALAVVDGNLDAYLESEMKRCQREAADLVPVDSGRGREVLMLPEAIKKTEDEGGGAIWAFGFLTDRMRKHKSRGGALHLFWVEFGTKAHNRGDALFRGKRDKRSASGKLRRAKRRKRSVPARPAQPFFRPAVANLLRRVESGRGIAAAVNAALDAKRGGGGGG